jgi:hypothetical protein
VGILSPIVQSLVGAVLHIGQENALGSSIGSQLVSNHALWAASLFSQQPSQQAFRSLCIAATLNDFIEHIAVLIDGAP